jgi:hypothetical protein
MPSKTASALLAAFMMLSSVTMSDETLAQSASELSLSAAESKSRKRRGITAKSPKQKRQKSRNGGGNSTAKSGKKGQLKKKNKGLDSPRGTNESANPIDRFSSGEASPVLAPTRPLGAEQSSPFIDPSVVPIDADKDQTDLDDVETPGYWDTIRPSTYEDSHEECLMDYEYCRISLIGDEKASEAFAEDYEKLYAALDEQLELERQLTESLEVLEKSLPKPPNGVADVLEWGRERFLITQQILATRISLENCRAEIRKLSGEFLCYAAYLDSFRYPREISECVAEFRMCEYTQYHRDLKKAA